MTTTAPRTSPVTSRRSLSTTSSPSHSPSSSISRGATARSAASPRTPSSLNSAATRRPTSKSSSVPGQNAEAAEALSVELKDATEKKEKLLVQLQDKDQTISTLGKENDDLTSALHAAEIRLNDLYAEQSRSEQELAQRIDISEKLRSQIQRTERQAFYDNEQHLKSRIQSLSQVRRKPESPTYPEVESETEYEEEETEVNTSPEDVASKQDMSDPEQEPAEMTALRLELSTLSTSYSSLQSTCVLLQTQLIDLNRVNKQLQEDNESYMILLQERTLSGQFDLLKQVGGGDDDDEESDRGDVGSLRSTGRSTLDRVEEEMPETTGSLADELSARIMPEGSDSHHGRVRQGRSHESSTSHSPDGPRGESLADLPITGPGLDLAAELGRAENKDILEGNVDEPLVNSKGKRSRKDSKGASGFLEPSVSTSDVLALRSEVKALKDANKALSLYASKIIDRIIAQEGFEHVLAIDYENEPPTPSTAAPKTAKARPQSVIVGRSASVSSGSESLHLNSPGFNVPKLGNPTPPSATTKASRRSLSFDWKGFSLFNNAEKKPESNLRPLTLKPGASPVTSARKLDTTEDENDRRERERINATMKLMGIETPASPAPMQKAFSSPGPAPPPSAGTNRRFSIFGSRTPASEPSSSPLLTFTPSLSANSSRIGLGIEGTELTQEALEHAEAENTLAALDAHERSLSSEIAKGSSGGFTEIRRSNRRGRRSAGGSDSGRSGRSTVWSAGMSATGEDDD
ncbi:m serotype precursor [Lentinula edodes]|uniref:M serotype n=1 Tax=Lentinula edodes TaxID=5353 RepID=A0A1Q3EQE1_LENED|nr:m serotype precursor [Lentinula edodes]